LTDRKSPSVKPGPAVAGMVAEECVTKEWFPMD
jgi:hypothetical protein